jgi:PAS domain S-box-containing protein
MDERMAEGTLLDRIFETNPTALIVLTPAGEITRCNQRAVEILQLEVSEIQGRTYEEPEWSFLRPNGEPIADGEHPFNLVMENRGPIFNREYRMGRPHAPTIDVSISGAPIIDEEGSIVRLVFSFEDITEERQRERQLNLRNEQLEEFASVVSHDLRNPLNVAMSRLELAKDEYEGEHLQPIETALDRMEAIIADTLVLAREGQAVGEPEPVGIREFAEECWEMVETAEATLEIVDKFQIYADRDRLLHVFENLFRNGVEHGDEGVTIRVGRLDDFGFYVEDDGPGIPEDRRADVLKPGYTESREGTGFGLAIVNRIAEAHGWTLSLAGSSDGGARFEFTNVDIRGSD